jgi:predicted Zn-dependent peptidase
LLQRFNHYTKDPGYALTWLAQLEAVSASDIQQAVARDLSEQHRVTVITRPTENHAAKE